METVHATRHNELRWPRPCNERILLGLLNVSYTKVVAQTESNAVILLQASVNWPESIHFSLYQRKNGHCRCLRRRLPVSEAVKSKVFAHEIICNRQVHVSAKISCTFPAIRMSEWAIDTGRRPTCTGLDTDLFWTTLYTDINTTG